MSPKILASKVEKKDPKEEVEPKIEMVEFSPSEESLKEHDDMVTPKIIEKKIELTPEEK